MLKMTRTLRTSLFWILLSGAISILWGFSIGQSGNGWVDFRAVYYGTRCLLQHHNPYKVSELDAVYRAQGGVPHGETPQAHQAVTLYVNVPTSFVLVAPFALLPWGAAHLLWLALIAGFFFLAAILVWRLGARHSNALSLFLICILLANCEAIFVTGNAAGLVVTLCVAAVWCFVEQRFMWAGVLCLAVSLAVKPHDSGFVWLYFLLAGMPYRKRALQSLLVTALMGLAAYVWLSHVAPGWIGDWRANLAAIEARGGINEPGLASLTGRSSSMVIDLQAATSVFWDNPRIYNLASYLVCGVMLLLWMVRTLRLRFTPARAWFALAAVVPLSLLITYHRPWDAKLLLLTVPGCAVLWASGRTIRWVALAVTTLGVVLTGDIPLALLNMMSIALHLNTTGLGGKLLALVLLRPASPVLMAMGVFYLWVYMWCDPGGFVTLRNECAERQPAASLPA